MRYCPYCRRLNPGQPLFCRFCGRTWHVRLCPRGHENPISAQYCGSCGSADLTEPAGRRRLGPYLVKALILVMLLAFLHGIGRLFLLSFTPETLAMLMRFTVIATLFWAGYWIALSVAPRPIKVILQRINRLVSQGLKRIGSLFWEKLNEFFQSLFNW